MTFQKKIKAWLLFSLVNLLFVCKKLVELGLVMIKTGQDINKEMPSEILLLFYRRWHALKKYCLKILSGLAHKKGLAICGVTIILFFLALTENSMAWSAKGQNFSQGTLSFALSNANGEEEIIEEGFPTIQDNNGPVASETIVQNITQTETDGNSMEETPTIATLDGSALIKPNILDEARPSTRTEIEEYIVQSGDNISIIAQKFGVSINTILWVNKLSHQSLIKIGKKLIIPPVTGIIHQVRQGDTVASLARTYRTEEGEIIEFNKLADGSDIKIGEKLIIPEGSLPYQAPIHRVARVSTASVATGGLADYLNWTRTTKCHVFDKGYCTSWVAYKWDTQRGQCVPKWSHAKYWLGRAIKSGFSACTRKGNKNCQPKVGAIIVTSWSWYGHVGYVEKVEGDMITFSEMNYKGWRIISQRTLNKNHRRIIGYIY
jgi:surface antigen